MLWSEAEGAVKVAVTACIVVLTLALVLWKVVAPVSVENGKGFAQDKNTMLHTISIFPLQSLSELVISGSEASRPDFSILRRGC